MKHLIYALLSAMFCCFLASCDKDNETSEPEFKIQGDELMVSYDGSNWKSVGKLQGASATQSQFKIEGENLMVSNDGTMWTSLGKVVGTNGLTPTFKVDNGSWLISYDNGKTWDAVGNSPTTNGSVSALVDTILVKGKIFAYIYEYGGNEYEYAKACEFNEDGNVYFFEIEDYSNGYAFSDTFKYVCTSKDIFTSRYEFYRLYSDGHNYYLDENDRNISDNLSQEDFIKIINEFGDPTELEFYKEIDRATLDEIIKIVKKIEEAKEKED